MKKKKLHTVPSCYLENFTDDEGLIWVSDVNDKIFRTKPSNILTENYFYTIRLPDGGGSLIVENILADIEGRYATVFKDKISEEIDIDEGERIIIAAFTALMLNRTKPVREGMRKFLKELNEELEKWREVYKNNPEAKSFSASLPKSGGQTFTRGDIKKILKNLDEVHSIGLMSTLGEITGIISEMRWCVLISEGKNFLTSDNPCAMLRPKSMQEYGPEAIGNRPGLRYKDVELTLPLSSKMALLAGWELKERFFYLKAEPREVKQINYRSIMYAKEKVIASSKTDLEELLTRQNLE